MNTILDVSGLSKRYGTRTVLHGVGFRVRAGQIVGLLGPNGAGKTTALECVEGLRRSDAGEVRFLGRPVVTGRVPRGMGVQLQISGLPGTMTVAESLRFVSAYRGATLRDDLLEQFQLGELRPLQYGQLSVGQQRRLQLALALAHRPRLLILDEPTAGLDVATRAQLHAAVRGLRREGAAVLLATHDMAEAEGLTDRCTIILDGRVVAEGTPRQLTTRGDTRTRISIATVHQRLAEAPEVPAALVQGEADGYLIYASDDAAATVSALLERVAERGDELVDLRVERPSLEQRFLELTRKEAA